MSKCVTQSSVASAILSASVICAPLLCRRAVIARGGPEEDRLDYLDLDL
jgi:hypothetical protein